MNSLCRCGAQLLRPSVRHARLLASSATAGARPLAGPVPSFMETEVHAHVFRLGEYERPHSVVALPSAIFNARRHPTLLAKVLRAQLLSARTPQVSGKNRGQVNYSGKKIRNQKGSGRARLGSRGSPMLVGGGRAWGGQVPNWTRLSNRKEVELALRVALSMRWREGKLCFVDGVAPRRPEDKGRTRALERALRPHGWLPSPDDKHYKRKLGSLFLLGSQTLKRDEGVAFVRASANLVGIEIASAVDVDLHSLLKADTVVLDCHGAAEIIRWLGPGAGVQIEEIEADWVDDVTPDVVSMPAES